MTTITNLFDVFPKNFLNNDESSNPWNKAIVFLNCCYSRRWKDAKKWEKFERQDPENSPFTWENRFEYIRDAMAMLKKYKVPIICLSEILDSYADQIKELFKGYTFVEKAYSKKVHPDDGLEHNILFLTIVDPKCVVSTNCSEYDGKNYMFTQVDDMLVCNAHFPMKYDSRFKQMEEAFCILQSYKGPAAIGGDFNTFTDDYSLFEMPRLCAQYKLINASTYKFQGSFEDSKLVISGLTNGTFLGYPYDTFPQPKEFLIDNGNGPEQWTNLDYCITNQYIDIGPHIVFNKFRPIEFMGKTYMASDHAMTMTFMKTK